MMNIICLNYRQTNVNSKIVILMNIIRYGKTNLVKKTFCQKLLYTKWKLQQITRTLVWHAKKRMFEKKFYKYDIKVMCVVI